MTNKIGGRIAFSSGVLGGIFLILEVFFIQDLPVFLSKRESFLANLRILDILILFFAGMAYYLGSKYSNKSKPTT